MAGFHEIKNLEDLIKDTIGGTITEQKVERLVPPGENFGSVIYKVDFTVNNEGSEKKCYAVAKCVPPNKITQEIFNTQVTFKAEIGWYTTAIPVLKQFQRDHGVEQEANFFQTFYGARISLDAGSDIVDEDGVIVTENLKSLGYINVDRHVGFDLKTSKAILRDLATFHAIAFALKRQNSNLFKEKITPFLPKLPNKAFDGMDPFSDLKDFLRDIPEIKPYLEQIFEYLDYKKAFDYDYEPNELWGTVCHSDFWTNNIMVTQEEDPRIMILDLQGPSYSSLASDLIFFLALSVTLDVVKIRMDELLEHYWNNFVKNLQQLGVNVDVYSYETFLSELSIQARRQLGHAFFIGQFVFLEKGHTNFDSSDANFEKDSFKNNKLNFNKIHKDRYVWIITEFAKRNWL